MGLAVHIVSRWLKRLKPYLGKIKPALSRCLHHEEICWSFPLWLHRSWNKPSSTPKLPHLPKSIARLIISVLVAEGRKMSCRSEDEVL